MEEKVQCPWCNKEIAPTKSAHKGTNGNMRISRCSACGSILSVRLEGEPDDILMKLPRRAD